MGGKKKKSPPQASAPAAPGNGVVEEPRKQAATSKPAKDSKSKGENHSQREHFTPRLRRLHCIFTPINKILVAIQADLEKKIIKLINEFRQENGDKGPISGRLTSKKLLDLYTALQKFNFKREHIEEAMKSSILYGGDLHSALDWLCLNLKDEELPDGFSQQMQEESQKNRPRFQPPVQQKPAAQDPKVSNNTTRREITKVCTERVMKDWILRYAEQSSEEEEEEGGKKTCNPELEEKFDPVSTIRQLESHPMFNPAIKVVDAPQKEKKILPAKEDKEELGFSLFEQAEKDPPAEKVVKKNEPKDIRNFDYTARSWTGKSPKQFLIDWVRKNLPKSPPPAFHKVACGRYWRCKVRVQRPDDVLEVCPTILTEDSMQAQHLGATLALYNLVKGQSSLCGYQIRMENQSGDWTRLLYCTTGVLLRKLQHDRHLTSLTHIIVDEVHERSVQSDFLLTILKDVVMKRSDLQLILMSATVDCDKFSNYFNRCPVISIPGRTFPVEVFHLEDIVEQTGYVLEKDSEYSQKILEEEEEVTISVTQKGGKTLQHQEVIVRDSSSGWDLGPDLDHFSSRTRHVLQYMNPNKVNMDLLVDLIDYLDKAPQFVDVDGAILVFLPGLAHIQQLFDLLSSDKRFRDKTRYRIVALHSTLSSKDQAAAFTVPPSGVRKIVLSTNIAETGVTIPDVVFVIDTGKTKENKYHESSQMSSLVETFISKASALQRQGRAGRVRNGFCFRLYPKYRFDIFMDYSIPEILRVPLEELCLHIMKCQYGSPEDFLSRALDAPQPQSVSNAVNLLRKIGACHPDDHILTPLGHHLASLPVNVKIGKMLIYGAILGCLEPIAIIAAAITEKSPFFTPMNRKEEANLAKAALAIANSDHLTIYNAYLGWKNSQTDGSRGEMSYCRKHFLNRTALITIEDVKRELMKMMEQVGFWSSRSSSSSSLKPQAASMSKQQISVLNAVLTAGLYDNVARVLCTPSVDVLERVACTVETPQGKAQVHFSSVNRNLQTHGWLLYQEKVKYTKIYLRDTTLISPFPMLLFGGDIDVQHRERLITLDGWIHFQAPVRIGVIFKHLRRLMDSLLERKLENPRMNLEGEATIRIILDLIKSEYAA
uniref:RNA helicase n=1 Tax=Maylandia zebra TaxID=106582 RepID=A0A3P9ASM8_9CICH